MIGSLKILRSSTSTHVDSAIEVHPIKGWWKMVAAIPYPLTPVYRHCLVLGQILDIDIWMRSLIYSELGGSSSIVRVILVGRTLPLEDPRHDLVSKSRCHQNTLAFEPSQ